MDQELKAYLDERFGQIDERFGQIDERFGQVDGRFGQMGERLGRVEERVGDNSLQIEALREEVRHTRVLVEAVDDNVRLVAEGVMGVSERLEAFQEEMVLGFQEVKASIRPYYQNLNGRVKILEAKADRQTEDVLESIRKMLGKPQA